MNGDVTVYNYQGLAERTSATATPEGVKAVQDRINADPTLIIRMLHCAIGKATEAGELLDQLKRHLFYGAPLDVVNLAEEIGDGKWYDAEGLNALGQSMLTAMQQNIDKLRVRFPDKYSDQAAVSRDLEAERVVLDAKVITKPEERNTDVLGTYRDLEKGERVLEGDEYTYDDKTWFPSGNWVTDGHQSGGLRYRRRVEVAPPPDCAYWPPEDPRWALVTQQTPIAPTDSGTRTCPHCGVQLDTMRVCPDCAAKGHRFAAGGSGGPQAAPTYPEGTNEA